MKNKIQVHSPSNIALIKYWGKFGVQFPCNPSVSLTLDKAKTITDFELIKNGQAQIEFKFDGIENPKFYHKIEKFFKENSQHFPNLLSHTLKISSMNTFPHSSGIASSASSMSALVMGALHLENSFSSKNEIDFKLASSLSRMASGSASRSIYPTLSLWGDYKDIGFNEYAVCVENLVDKRFQNFCDSIVIVSSEEKAVSSRAGHALMDGHPYREVRFLEAKKRLEELMSAMNKYDLEKFIEIVEKEALDLHSLMMTSEPSFILLEGKTIDFIKKLRAFRHETKTPVCFTLDAGPNLHVLYPFDVKDKVQSFLTSLSSPASCPMIHDQVGAGTKILVI